MSKKDKIQIFDSTNFCEISDALEISLKKSETREDFEIISMVLSFDKEYLAVIIGKNLIMCE